MFLDEHTKSCEQQLGSPATLVHLFLDQFASSYARKFGRQNMVYHRHVLHHEQGIRLITDLFGTAMGAAARCHIMDDLAAGADSPAIPVDWDSLPVYGNRADHIRAQIKRDHERISGLTDRFSLLILGDTDGARRQILRPLLGKADIIIVAGYHWDRNNQNQSPARALHRLFSFAPVINMRGSQQAWQDFSIHSQHICLDPEHLPDKKSLVIAQPSTDGQASLIQQSSHLILQPGYCGHDTNTPLAPILVESSNHNTDRTLLSITCLHWLDSLKSWIDGERTVMYHT